jgi:predicted nucleic acid-binding protein
VSFLLDTCVLSELTKQKPDSNVTRWLGQIPDRAKFVSVISLAEIKFGILCAPAGQKRNALERWYENELRPFLADRALVFDHPVSQRWAALRAMYRRAPVLDAQIAATALEHGLTLVTRNVRDFAFEGLSVFNPW